MPRTSRLRSGPSDSDESRQGLGSLPSDSGDMTTPRRVESPGGQEQLPVSIHDAKKEQAFHPAVVFWLSAWYATSLVTLFMNKIILTTEGGDQYVLGITQMCMTATLGAVKVYGGRTQGSKAARGEGYRTFNRDMALVGLMRGGTVLLGLVSLSHVAVSFTETIKSSAPLFTVLFARLILREMTPWQVQLTLIPVMFGLILSSATEISFDSIGFGAAVANNVIDCVQNVFSKKLLQKLTPVELQFYTSVAAAIIQLPMILYSILPKLLVHNPIGWRLGVMLFIDGLSYHFQSVTAYYTMDYLSPVSQSVANTLKRALLIMLSIWYFGNAVTAWNILGCGIVIGGVFVYNVARTSYTVK